MAMDFSDVFAKYEALVASVDKVFDTVRQACGPAVTCSKGCSDCCHAVFDLSLVESMYVNDRFNAAFKDAAAARDAVLVRAEEAERRQVKLVRKAQKRFQQGEEAEAVLADVAGRRIRCPLLSAENGCELYHARPITCRLYGIPQNIAGEVHTCGLSGFEKGQTYPTVKLEKIQDALVELSMEIMSRLKTKYSGLHTTHMPLSTALMNAFDEEYLGVKQDKVAMADEEAGPDPLGGGASDPFAPAPQVVSGKDGACSGCDKSDCSGCASSKDGCGGSPTIIEFPGAE